jgi:hypothetical protein
VSWTDMVTSVLLSPRHAILSGGLENGGLSTILLLLLIPVLLFLAVILKGRPQWIHDAKLTGLLTIAACFYAVCGVAISAIFLRGGDVSVEERHLRAAGMLIFVCVLAITVHLPQKSPYRLAAFALFVFMSLYGGMAFAYRAWSTKRGEVDRYSGTHQPSVDRSAIDFVRAAFAKEGQDAVFVLPAADAACILSPGARILLNQIEFESEATIAARTYRGKVRGRVYVVVPKHIAQSPKAVLLLKEFVDYPPTAWESLSFGDSTVYVQ